MSLAQAVNKLYEEELRHQEEASGQRRLFPNARRVSPWRGPRPRFELGSHVRVESRTRWGDRGLVVYVTKVEDAKGNLLRWMYTVRFPDGKVTAHEEAELLPLYQENVVRRRAWRAPRGKHKAWPDNAAFAYEEAVVVKDVTSVREDEGVSRFIGQRGIVTSITGPDNEYIVRFDTGDVHFFFEDELEKAGFRTNAVRGRHWREFKPGQPVVVEKPGFWLHGRNGWIDRRATAIEVGHTIPAYYVRFMEGIALRGRSLLLPETWLRLS
jgi:hypothetical protein